MSSQNIRYDDNLDWCLDAMKSWRNYINTYVTKDKEKEAELEKLSKITKDYMEINNNYKRAEKAIQEVQNRIGDENLNVREIYLESIKKQEDKNYSDDIWQTIFGNSKDVEEVIKKSKQLNDSQYDSVDDSLMCSNVFTPPIDPVTKAPIRNPMKNRICKHIYEGNTIFDFMRQSRHGSKCPYIGCRNKQILAERDLQLDATLKGQIDRYFEENEDQDDDDSD